MNENSYKYLTVIQYIKDMADKGKINSCDRLPTENELALNLDFSRITIQKAYSELEKEGYIYRIRGKGTFLAKQISKSNDIKTNKLKFVGVILSVDSEMEMSYDIVQGIQAYTTKRNCYVTVHNSAMDAEEEERIINGLLDDGVCGIILQCVDENKNLKLYRSLIQKKIPLVFVDRYPCNMSVDFVGVDNYMGAYRIVNHLVGLGHKHIAFVSQSRDNLFTVNSRYEGYCAALSDNGIEINQELIKIIKESNDSTQNVAEHIIERLMNQPEVPSAIFAVNDYMALSCINKLIKLNISVPDDISVVGFDNISDLDHLMVPLTTMERPFKLIGREAAGLVFKRLNYPGMCYTQIFLPVNLIIRESASYANTKYK